MCGTCNDTTVIKLCHEYSQHITLTGIAIVFHSYENGKEQIK